MGIFSKYFQGKPESHDPDEILAAAKGWKKAQEIADAQKRARPSTYSPHMTHNQLQQTAANMQNTIMTGSPTCTCASCDILDTVMGTAMLEWGRALIKNVREAVETGAKTDTEMTLTLHGPSVATFKQGYGGSDNQVSYSNVTFTLGDLTMPQAPEMEPTPDLAALEAEYADDPVALALIAWIKGRKL